MRGLASSIVALVLVGSLGVAADGSRGAPIEAGELAERIQSGSAPFVLDVRTPSEYASGHVPGATNIPHDELATRIGELPADRSEEIVVHCQSGRRARMAEATLEEHGYTNVRDLVGHWQGWSAAGLPVE